MSPHDPADKLPSTGPGGTPRVSPHIAALAPYVPGRPEEEIAAKYGVKDPVKLASNENPLGPSPKALQAIRAHLSRIHRYPVSDGCELRKAISEKLDVPMDGVVLGAGSSDLIECSAIAFLDRDENAVISEGAFIMYKISVQRVNGNIRWVPLKERTHDLQAMASAINDKTKIVYIANPNNPTGTYVPAGEMAAFLESVPRGVLVVVDEAYREYIDRPDFPDTLRTVRSGAPNLVVLRTFSKVQGLAGLRIGMGIMHPELAREFHRVRSPFNSSRIGQVAALAALDDRSHIRRSVAMNRREKDFLEKAFAERGIPFTPSVGNFVLLDVGCDPMKLFDRMCARGVIIRPVANYGFKESIRITVGTHDQNSRLLEALDQALPEARGR